MVCWLKLGCMYCRHKRVSTMIKDIEESLKPLTDICMIADDDDNDFVAKIKILLNFYKH